MKKYLIFIPVYNEEESLPKVVSILRRYKDISDILIIDDGSDDQTPKVMDELPDITGIKHQGNKGYGATLIEGFNYAIEQGYEYVITIDSDKQHQPEEVEQFIQINETSDFDILSGSRYLAGDDQKVTEAPEERRKVNKRITDKINKITGYQLTDGFCGFKLYKTKALAKLNLTEPGYAMPLQLWLQAWKQNLTVKEISVSLIYFDRNVGVAEAYKNVFRRYRYYLEIIKKEIENYENISISSAS